MAAPRKRHNLADVKIATFWQIWSIRNCVQCHNRLFGNYTLTRVKCELEHEHLCGVSSNASTDSNCHKDFWGKAGKTLVFALHVYTLRNRINLKVIFVVHALSLLENWKFISQQIFSMWYLKWSFYLWAVSQLIKPFYPNWIAISKIVKRRLKQNSRFFFQRW